LCLSQTAKASSGIALLLDKWGVKCAQHGNEPMRKKKKHNHVLSADAKEQRLTDPVLAKLIPLNRRLTKTISLTKHYDCPSGIPPMTSKK
jgi:hypothetical protein